MSEITRRAALGGTIGVAAASVGLRRARAQSARPLRIGVSNDGSGPYVDIGGPGTAAAVRLAVEEFGGKVLGRPIEVIHGDNQNKPDVAANLARQWYDTQDVEMIVDGSATSSSLAILQVANEKKKAFLASGPASSDFSGKACSPYMFHVTYDTYMLANLVGRTLTQEGGNTWFFLTADYAFGYALERDTSAFVVKGGGKVLGSARHPLGSTDFSSYLVQARASGAKIVGLANAGTDAQNAIKQAAEFGIVRGGQRLASLLVFASDVAALGLDAAQGLVLAETFYWDLDDSTRAWTKRFRAVRDQIPTMVHAHSYAITRHWLHAIEAAGTTDTLPVLARMKATPMNDMINKDVTIREDGRVLNRAFLFQVKTPAESTSKADIYKLLATVPGAEAYRPLSESECPLVKKA
jgi:branched-chain amino acid transport system substrate-binding protein